MEKGWYGREEGKKGGLKDEIKLVGEYRAGGIPCGGENLRQEERKLEEQSGRRKG